MGRCFRQGGHKRALCISDNDVCMDKDRFDGFCHGFGGGELLIVPMRKAARWEFYRENLEKIRSVSAIFAVSDHYAIDLIHFLSEQGIRVPEDISVAGFDDTPMCQMVSPALTSVRQDVALRAKIAVQKLRELKEKRETETTIKLPVTLICRGSTRSLE